MVLIETITLYPRLESFLQQDMHERAGYDQSLADLRALFHP